MPREFQNFGNFDPMLTGHRFSAGDWRFLRSSTVPTFSKTQSFQGLEIPESEEFFRSCIKETALWRASVLGAACPTVLWSLIITLCVRLLKTQTRKECPKTEILGFIKAAKKLDSISLRLPLLQNIYIVTKKSPKQNSFRDFYKGWVEIYQSALLIWQVSWSLFPPLPWLCYSCQNTWFV